MSDPAAPPSGGAFVTSGPLDPSVAISLLQRAQQLAAQGEYDLAAGTFWRCVGNSDPTIHVAALLGFAECRYRLDDEPGALQAWIMATQAPETPLTWRAWKALAAARVRDNDLVGAARAYREAEKRAPVEERPEIASRLGWLNKEMGRQGTAESYFARARTGGAPIPVVTYAILAVTIAIGISVLFLGQAEFWYGLFALTKTGIEQGEYWRLITVVLVHDNNLFLHLAFNMYALWIVGPIVEGLYGPVRYLAIYLICAAAASTASYVFSSAEVSVGASGAIFGLFSCLLVADKVHKPALTRNARYLTSQIGFLIVINLVLGFAMSDTIDNAAHIGGLLGGAWLGFIWPPRGATMLRSFWSQPQPVGPQAPPGTPVAPNTLAAEATGARPDRFDGTRLLQLVGVLALIAVIVVGVAVGPVTPFA